MDANTEGPPPGAPDGAPPSPWPLDQELVVTGDLFDSAAGLQTLREPLLHTLRATRGAARKVVVFSRVKARLEFQASLHRAGATGQHDREAMAVFNALLSTGGVDIRPDPTDTPANPIHDDFDAVRLHALDHQWTRPLAVLTARPPLAKAVQANNTSPAFQLRDRPHPVLVLEPRGGKMKPWGAIHVEVLVEAPEIDDLLHRCDVSVDTSTFIDMGKRPGHGNGRAGLLHRLSHDGARLVLPQCVEIELMRLRDRPVEPAADAGQRGSSKDLGMAAQWALEQIDRLTRNRCLVMIDSAPDRVFADPRLLRQLMTRSTERGLCLVTSDRDLAMVAAANIRPDASHLFVTQFVGDQLVDWRDPANRRKRASGEPTDDGRRGLPTESVATTPEAPAQVAAVESPAPPSSAAPQPQPALETPRETDSSQPMKGSASLPATAESPPQGSPAAATPTPLPASDPDPAEATPLPMRVKSPNQRRAVLAAAVLGATGVGTWLLWRTPSSGMTIALVSEGQTLARDGGRVQLRSGSRFTVQVSARVAGLVELHTVDPGGRPSPGALWQSPIQAGESVLSPPLRLEGRQGLETLRVVLRALDGSTSAQQTIQVDHR